MPLPLPLPLPFPAQSVMPAGRAVAPQAALACVLCGKEHACGFRVLPAGAQGSVVHILGGTAASLVAFFVPGLLLVNASVVKHSQLLVESHQVCPGSSRRGPFRQRRLLTMQCNHHP